MLGLIDSRHSKPSPDLLEEAVEAQPEIRWSDPSHTRRQMNKFEPEIRFRHQPCTASPAATDHWLPSAFLWVADLIR